MRYVEEIFCKNMTPAKVNYDDYYTAIKSMENNALLDNLMSSCLRDSKGNLLATYEKGEGVKMVEYVKELKVSEETFNFMNDTKKSYYELYSLWGTCSNSKLYNALSELNKVVEGKYVSGIFDMLTKGEAKLVKKEKLYRVILPGVHSTGGAHWKYIFNDEDGDIDTSNQLENVAQLTKEQLEELPEKLQELAKEVEQ